MNSRITSAAVASALALSLMASASFAATNASEAHAYFEAQRQLTDGHTAPSASRAGETARSGTAAARTESERQFLFQLGRTDGSVEPWSVTEQRSPQQLTGTASAPAAAR